MIAGVGNDPLVGGPGDNILIPGAPNSQPVATRRHDDYGNARSAPLSIRRRAQGISDLARRPHRRFHTAGRTDSIQPTATPARPDAGRHIADKTSYQNIWLYRISGISYRFRPGLRAAKTVINC